MLEERPRRTCCGRPRTQRLHGTTVLVRDGTGMEICNANCSCANHWIVLLTTYTRDSLVSRELHCLHVIDCLSLCVNSQVDEESGLAGDAIPALKNEFQICTSSGEL